MSRDLIIELLKEFVAIDTTSTEHKNFHKMVDVIEKRAREFGLVVERIIDSKGIPHLKITLPETPQDGKRVVFLTHYDVVPPGDGWSFDPFNPIVKDGKVYGRGAADDKSGIVAGLVALKEVLDENLIPKIIPELIVAGGEETGESVEFFRKISGDIAVVLDVGPEGLSIGASGAARVKVIVKGKQAHSAYPFRGKNPIYDAAKLISFLEEYAKRLEKEKRSQYAAPEYYDRLPARLSVTMIHGGIAPNVIPSDCEIIIDRRTIPEEDAEKVAQELKNMILDFAKKSGISVEIEARGLINGWVTEDKQIIEKFKKILEELLGQEVRIVVELGGTDGVHLINRMPVIQFGALRSDNNIHGKDEFVYINDVVLVKDFIKKVITTEF
ncbi:MAG: ArgE/DapE family deacylase [Candidatus Njordarchaeales archaeon]|mgnify:CR=1 FL=1